MQEALELSEKFLPLEIKLKQAHREGLIRGEYLSLQIDEAERAEVISATEAADLRDYNGKLQFLMSVDDFAPEEFGYKQSSDVNVTSTIAKKKSAKKSPNRKTKKKTIRKKATEKKR